MKRSILLVAGLASVALLWAVWPVNGAPKSKQVTVKGEVVDLWCYLDHKGHGAKHKACAISCVKAGNPVGIATEKGKVYVLMGGKKHQSGQEVLLDKMAETVTVTGALIKNGGVQAIYVSEVK